MAKVVDKNIPLSPMVKHINKTIFDKEMTEAPN